MRFDENTLFNFTKTTTILGYIVIAVVGFMINFVFCKEVLANFMRQVLYLEINQQKSRRAGCN